MPVVSLLPRLRKRRRHWLERLADWAERLRRRQFALLREGWRQRRGK